MREKDKFTIERARPRKTSLPPEPLTGITWNQLVTAISRNGIFMADRIRYANEGTGGTREIDGSDMLRLWKEVERNKAKEQNGPQAATPEVVQ